VLVVRPKAGEGAWMSTLESASASHWQPPRNTCSQNRCGVSCRMAVSAGAGSDDVM
jgi:hypothetical protein